MVEIDYRLPIDKIELNNDDYIVYTRTIDDTYYSWLPIPESPRISYFKGEKVLIYNVLDNQSKVYYKHE